MYHSYTNEQMQRLLTGTTTVGVVCKDGVVLATDRRAVAGRLVAHKHADKIFEVDTHLGATIAGSVADAQTAMDILRASASLYRIQKENPIRVGAAARLLANILFQSRLFPYVLQVVIGGLDDTGPRLFILDLFGSVIEDSFASTGSGSPVAYGVLEDSFNSNLTIRNAIPLAIRAVHSAVERDVATGNGIDVVTITKSGFSRMPEEEVWAEIEKLIATKKRH
ncbi:MAG: archaeal proteasome endopeptidase complex subunit beta [Promethearchaeota archaeon]